MSEGDSPFEIFDYSNSTELEKLVASLEDQLSFLKLAHGWGQTTSLGVHLKTIDSYFGKIEFRYIHNHDFPHIIHDGIPSPLLCISDNIRMDDVSFIEKWYGVKDYIVARANASYTSSLESHVLLGAIAVALRNIDCCIPVFVSLLLDSSACTFYTASDSQSPPQLSDLTKGLNSAMVLGVCSDAHGIHVQFQSDRISIPHHPHQDSPFSYQPQTTSSADLSAKSKSTMLRSFFPFHMNSPKCFTFLQLCETFLSRIPLSFPTIHYPDSFYQTPQFNDMKQSTQHFSQSNACCDANQQQLTFYQSLACVPQPCAHPLFPFTTASIRHVFVRKRDAFGLVEKRMGLISRTINERIAELRVLVEKRIKETKQSITTLAKKEGIDPLDFLLSSFLTEDLSVSSHSSSYSSSHPLHMTTLHSLCESSELTPLSYPQLVNFLKTTAASSAADEAVWAFYNKNLVRGSGNGIFRLEVPLPRAEDADAMMNRIEKMHEKTAAAADDDDGTRDDEAEKEKQKLEAIEELERKKTRKYLVAVKEWEDCAKANLSRKRRITNWKMQDDIARKIEKEKQEKSKAQKGGQTGKNSSDNDEEGHSLTPSSVSQSPFPSPSTSPSPSPSNASSPSLQSSPPTYSSDLSSIKKALTEAESASTNNQSAEPSAELLRLQQQYKSLLSLQSILVLLTPMPSSSEYTRTPAGRFDIKWGFAGTDDPVKGFEIDVLMENIALADCCHEELRTDCGKAMLGLIDLSENEKEEERKSERQSDKLRNDDFSTVLLKDLSGEVTSKAEGGQTTTDSTKQEEEDDQSESSSLCSDDVSPLSLLLNPPSTHPSIWRLRCYKPDMSVTILGTKTKEFLSLCAMCMLLDSIQPAYTASYAGQAGKVHGKVMKGFEETISQIDLNSAFKLLFAWPQENKQVESGEEDPEYHHSEIEDAASDEDEDDRDERYERDESSKTEDSDRKESEEKEDSIKESGSDNEDSENESKSASSGKDSHKEEEKRGRGVKDAAQSGKDSVNSSPTDRSTKAASPTLRSSKTPPSPSSTKASSSTSPQKPEKSFNTHTDQFFNGSSPSWSLLSRLVSFMSSTPKQAMREEVLLYSWQVFVTSCYSSWKEMAPLPFLRSSLLLDFDGKAEKEERKRREKENKELLKVSRQKIQEFEEKVKREKMEERTRLDKESVEATAESSCLKENSSTAGTVASISSKSEKEQKSNQHKSVHERKEGVHSFVDHRDCLIHQKLEMLNYCICEKRRMQRAALEKERITERREFREEQRRQEREERRRKRKEKKRKEIEKRMREEEEEKERERLEHERKLKEELKKLFSSDESLSEAKNENDENESTGAEDNEIDKLAESYLSKHPKRNKLTSTSQTESSDRKESASPKSQKSKASDLPDESAHSTNKQHTPRLHMQNIRIHRHTLPPPRLSHQTYNYGRKAPIVGLQLIGGGQMWEPEMFVAPPSADDEREANTTQQMAHQMLKSDIEAFKAANEEATLEDFVRWFSPRDWVIEVGGVEIQCPVEYTREYLGCTPRLSHRMTFNPDCNTWMEMWASTTPKRIVDQQPLFNPTKQAEAILDYLLYMKPSELFEQLSRVWLNLAFSALFYSTPLNAYLSPPSLVVALQKMNENVSDGSAKVQMPPPLNPLPYLYNLMDAFNLQSCIQQTPKSYGSSPSAYASSPLSFVTRPSSLINMMPISAIANSINVCESQAAILDSFAGKFRFCPSIVLPLIQSATVELEREKQKKAALLVMGEGENAVVAEPEFVLENGKWSIGDQLALVWPKEWKDEAEDWKAKKESIPTKYSIEGTQQQHKLSSSETSGFNNVQASSSFNQKVAEEMDLSSSLSFFPSLRSVSGSSKQEIIISVNKDLHIETEEEKYEKEEKKKEKQKEAQMKNESAKMDEIKQNEKSTDLSNHPEESQPELPVAPAESSKSVLKGKKKRAFIIEDDDGDEDKDILNTSKKIAQLSISSPEPSSSSLSTSSSNQITSTQPSYPIHASQPDACTLNDGLCLTEDLPHRLYALITENLIEVHTAISQGVV
ncbi:putative Rab3 GTPase-activating protein catalytic subunit [Monocercomonoides exilis]|uniref:putative Rab3 GTPase-activating protein catalytic subunit n=1 Tax=Monocercomonoides exilis TaxID=2049356 RepID=UPI00355A36F2|nr:putative Rab3 GTPase-activating protein catalytic subunit [Monocercomonoides exilis]